ncbi:MAG: PEP/pyruvate-binding domain-containing protein [Myxococcota bacterium]
MTHILAFGEAHGSEAWRTGPKAAHLSALYEAGFRVPRGFAVAAEALDRYLAANGIAPQVHELLIDLDNAGFESIGDRPARLRDLIMTGKVPEDLAGELREALAGLGNVPVAVRSSSSLEDRADLSFAGQHDSFLNVCSYEECAEALKKVWASLWSDRAVAYLRALDMSTRQIRMGVVVQELIPADVSGVSFTVHPVTGDYEQLVVSASAGLGESTVSGKVTPDEATVRRDPREVVSYQIGAKASMVVAADDGDVEEVTLSPAQRSARSLSEAQVLDIAYLALRVEEFMAGDPQDVEWALRDGELFLLQARPMVRPRAREGAVWESPIAGARWRRNWRLGEWLPDPVTPLFASWVLPKLVAAREEFGTGRLGWHQRPAFSMAHPWFCIVNGYFYTRVGFPRSMMRRAMPNLEERVKRMAEGGVFLRHWREELLPAYLEHFEDHRARDIRSSSSRELLDFVELLAEEAGEFWFLIAPLGYGFEAMMFKPYFEEKIPEGDRPHYSSLFSGYPNRILDSQQALYELSQDIRRDADAASSFVSLKTGEATLDSLPEWLRERIRAYASEYGHQLISLDFYFPSMGESYEHTLSALQAFVRYEVQSPEKMREGAERKREQAVPRILEQLEEGSDDHRMMAAMISNYQTNASVREDANFYLQLGWPLMRAAIQELGRRLVAADVLADPEEIFFVEKEELQGAMVALQRGETPASLH